MSGRGDQRLADALLTRLAGGACDVLDLLAAARAALGGTLTGHEGALHPVLHRLVRQGHVAPQARSPRGLTLYALAGAASGAVAAGEAAGAPPAVPAEVQRVATGVRAQDARARIGADLAAHLAELDARGRRDDAGHVRGLRGLLKRADRGHPAVFLPQGAGGHLLRLVLHEGPWILAAVVVYLLLNAFVVKVFVIPSASMLPTLQHGDRVVVRLTGAGWQPERWQIVTYQRPGQDGPRTTYVKRVVGLPSERIALWRGDVYIDDQLVAKPEGMNALVRRPVKAWDLTAPEGRAGWLVASLEAGVDTWSMAERWFTGAPDIERRFELQDVYLELDVDLGATGGASLRLMRGREPLERRMFTLVADPTRGVQVTRDDLVGTRQLAGDAFVRRGRQTLRMSVVDGLVRASVGGFAWEERLTLPAEPAVISFVVSRGAVPLAFRLDQDLHYSLDGVHAVAPNGDARSPLDVEHAVGAEALFCLGDNTTDSRDSRFQDVGDIPLAQLVGPVVGRIWPLGRLGRPR